MQSHVYAIEANTSFLVLLSTQQLFYVDDFRHTSLCLIVKCARFPFFWHCFAETIPVRKAIPANKNTVSVWLGSILWHDLDLASNNTLHRRSKYIVLSFLFLFFLQACASA